MTAGAAEHDTTMNEALTRGAKWCDNSRSGFDDARGTYDDGRIRSRYDDTESAV